MDKLAGISKADREFQTEDDARTLTRAAEISTDPNRSTAARRLIGRQHRALGRVRKSLAGKSMTGRR